MDHTGVILGNDSNLDTNCAHRLGEFYNNVNTQESIEIQSKFSRWHRDSGVTNNLIDVYGKGRREPQRLKAGVRWPPYRVRGNLLLR